MRWVSSNFGFYDFRVGAAVDAYNTAQNREPFARIAAARSSEQCGTETWCPRSSMPELWSSRCDPGDLSAVEDGAPSTVLRARVLGAMKSLCPPALACFGTAIGTMKRGSGRLGAPRRRRGAPLRLGGPICCIVSGKILGCKLRTNLRQVSATRVVLGQLLHSPIRRRMGGLYDASLPSYSPPLLHDP